MAFLKEIKDRIASVRGTLKITSAMKMVASAKLHKAQQAIGNMLPYERCLHNMLLNLMESSSSDKTGTEATLSGDVSSLMTRRDVRKVAIVAFASNSSLCGAFNSNAIREAAAMIDEYRSAGLRDSDIVVYSVGRKMAEAMRKLGFPSPADFTKMSDSPSYEAASALAQELLDGFSDGRFDKVEFVYNHYKSTSSQPTTRMTYLPLSLDDMTTGSEEGNPAGVAPVLPRGRELIVEPSPEAFVRTLLPKVVSLRVFSTLLDSAAAEHAARTVAMQLATDNGDGLLQELTLEYNKGRQQKITSEILDIVGGSLQQSGSVGGALKFVAVLLVGLLPFGAFAQAKPEKVVLGDERFEMYLPLLEGKRVAVFSNQTGIVGDKVAGSKLADALSEYGGCFPAPHRFNDGRRGPARPPHRPGGRPSVRRPGFEDRSRNSLESQDIQDWAMNQPGQDSFGRPEGQPKRKARRDRSRQGAPDGRPGAPSPRIFDEISLIPFLEPSVPGGKIEYGQHVVDALLEKGVDVTAIFSPEHGFRGDADAGEHVGSSVDEKTGVEILSLYGTGSRIPGKDKTDKFDVLVVDIQDVGLRYYTYYVTMHHLMEACARDGKKVVVLDRPNPNGFYVDGPVLDMKFKSGVGWLPITTVHGMTLGELALMINGEKWLENGTCDLTVVPCLNYTHNTRYSLILPPSPNIKDMRAVYLYSSTCYFEGTVATLGRGTSFPFEAYGHPQMTGYSFSFVPKSIPGAKKPQFLEEVCYGVDLRLKPLGEIWTEKINLEYVVDAYRNLNMGDKFFGKNNFFELLAGVDWFRSMIESGSSADEISARWSSDVESFKERRAPYLLY